MCVSFSFRTVTPYPKFISINSIQIETGSTILYSSVSVVTLAIVSQLPIIFFGQIWCEFRFNVELHIDRSIGQPDTIVQVTPKIQDKNVLYQNNILRYRYMVFTTFFSLVISVMIMIYKFASVTVVLQPIGHKTNAGTYFMNKIFIFSLYFFTIINGFFFIFFL